MRDFAGGRKRVGVNTHILFPCHFAGNGQSVCPSGHVADMDPSGEPGEGGAVRTVAFCFFAGVFSRIGTPNVAFRFAFDTV